MLFIQDIIPTGEVKRDERWIDLKIDEFFICYRNSDTSRWIVMNTATRAANNIMIELIDSIQESRIKSIRIKY